MSKRLRKAYDDTVTVLRKHGVEVRDAAVDDIETILFNRDTRYVIVIGKVRSLRRRFFVLCHELGHVMYVGRGGLTLRKGIASERSANKVACELIGFLDKKLVKRFENYYNHLNRNSRRARFKA